MITFLRGFLIMSEEVWLDDKEVLDLPRKIREELEKDKKEKKTDVYEVKYTRDCRLERRS